MSEVSRRTLIKATGAIGAAILPAGPAFETANVATPAGAIPAAASPICAAAAAATIYVFFNSEEAAFIEAAVARLIPADEEWPGALEACVPNYIDEQLGGAWGEGERLYRSGPGSPEHGLRDISSPSRRRNCFEPRWVRSTRSCRTRRSRK